MRIPAIFTVRVLLCLFAFIFVTGIVYSWYNDIVQKFNDLQIGEENDFKSLFKPEFTVTRKSNQLQAVQDARVLSTSTMTTQEIQTLSTTMRSSKPRYLEFLSYFRPRNTRENLTKLRSLFVDCVGLLEKQNITYIGYYNTLLGAHRHHGRVPWDDRLDIIVDSEKKSDVYTIFTSAKFGVETRANNTLGSWKLYDLSAKKLPGQNISFPFVKIYFMNRKGGDYQVELENDFVIRGEYMFPLVKRTFNNIVINTPCNISGVLEDYYGDVTKCQSPYPKLDKSETVTLDNARVENCTLLQPYFPFVRRSTMFGSENVTFYEDLVFRNEKKYNVMYSAPAKCTNDYSIQENNIKKSKY